MARCLGCVQAGDELLTFEPLLFDHVTFVDKDGIAMGAFDQPTGTEMALHIFVAEKGDYYQITDGLPQNEY